jgi:long-chain acyl-CoA synthetase
VKTAGDPTALHPALNALAHAARAPARPMYTQPLPGGVLRRWTWGQGLDEAQRIAAALAALGIAPGDRVAILSKNCAWWMLADLAIWLAGGVSVPLYPTSRASTWRHVIEHSGAKALFVGKLDALPDLTMAVPPGLPTIAFPNAPAGLASEVLRWQALLETHEPAAEAPVGAPDALATLIYTSGTTGEAKGVMHSHANLVRAARITAARYATTANERALSYLPLAHAAERCAVECNQFVHGFHVFFADTLDSFVQDLQRAQPTMFVSVPRLFARFRDGVHAKLPAPRLARLLKLPLVGGLVRRKVLAGLGLDQARYVGGGGSPIPPDLIDWYGRLGIEVCEAYGMSENFAVSHGAVWGEIRAGWVGKPYDGVVCKLSAEGEVWVKSPCNFLGYWQDSERSAATLDSEGFVHTGDKGEIDAQGRLRITGRLRDAFKTSKAKYVWPGPIEAHLLALPGVEQACVCGDGFAEPFALVVAKAGTDPAALESSLVHDLAHLNAEVLEAHERLRFLVLVPEFTIADDLLTDTLKVKRHAIEARYGARFVHWYNSGQAVIQA